MTYTISEKQCSEIQKPAKNNRLFNFKPRFTRYDRSAVPKFFLGVWSLWVQGIFDFPFVPELTEVKHLAPWPLISAPESFFRHGELISRSAYAAAWWLGLGAFSLLHFKAAVHSKTLYAPVS